MMMILMMITLKLLLMIDLRPGVTDTNNARHIKKDISKELMALAWHPTKWRDYCMTKGLNKIEPFYIHEKQFKMSQLVKL